MKLGKPLDPPGTKLGVGLALVRCILHRKLELGRLLRHLHVVGSAVDGLKKRELCLWWNVY